MSFTVHFFTFAKKVNSTAVPDQNHPVTSINCELKAETSMITPTIKLHRIENVDAPFSWNYCQIPAFNRFYFIRDFRWNNGLWECDLKCDVLATYKNAILASSQYVLRTATVYLDDQQQVQALFNPHIHDAYYPTQRTVFANRLDMGNSEMPYYSPRLIRAQINGGYFIIGVISKFSSVGSIAYYIMDAATFRALKDTMLTDAVDFTGVEDISAELLNCTFNPYDYIVSCKWLPVENFDHSLLTLTATNVFMFGYWSLEIPNATMYVVDPLSIPEYIWNWYVAPQYLPKHPQASRGDYLHGPEYTKITMNIAPYGTIDITNDIYYLGVHFNEVFDVISGESTLRVILPNENDTGLFETFQTYTAHMAVDIQLAQVKSAGGIENTATGILATVGHNIVESIGVESPIKNIASGIINTYMNDSMTVKVGSPNGSFSALTMFGTPSNRAAKPVMNFTFMHVVEEDFEHFGRPLCQKLQLLACNGFVLCKDAEVPINGTEIESNEVADFLNNGFFVE